MDKVKFKLDDGTEAEFFVLEQAKLYGESYILVTDEEEGDGDALILKEIAIDKNKEITYEVVADDELLSALAPLFEGLLEDVRISHGIV